MQNMDLVGRRQQFGQKDGQNRTGRIVVNGVLVRRLASSASGRVKKADQHAVTGWLAILRSLVV
jgi:hypothetical protein